MKMTIRNGTIRIKKEPWQIIEWFTRNFNNEIGALGIGTIINNEMVIEKLVFPNQIVSGAHVHFKPEDWSEICSELTDEEFSNIIFYWHKHPNGSVGASSGDEENTFDVFMGKEADRPIFGFLQTAYSKVNNNIQVEARLEIRQPVIATLLDVRLIAEQDSEIETTCKSIIKKYITIGNEFSTYQPEASKEPMIREYGYTTPPTNLFEKTIWDTTPTKNTEVEDTNFFMNVYIQNGQVIIDTVETFKEMIQELLNNELSNQVSYFNISKNAIGDTQIKIFPKKKCIHDIYKYFYQLASEMFYEQNGDEDEQDFNKSYKPNDKNDKEEQKINSYIHEKLNETLFNTEEYQENG